MGIKSFFMDLIVSDSKVSSARFLNVMGGVTSAILITGDTIYNSKLSIDVLSAFLLYCAGQYGASKLIDKKYSEEKITTEKIQ